MRERSKTASTRSQSVINGSQRSSRGVSGTKNNHLLERVTTSRGLIITVVVIALFATVGIWDLSSNWGKAYGNVTVNGMSVAGMDESQIQETLKSAYGQRVSHAQVTIYANEDAMQKGRSSIEELEAAALADQVSYEDAIASNNWWQTDALSLHATLPYEETAKEAVSFGRDDGGILARMDLLFGTHDVSFGVGFDDKAIDDLAAEIDKTIGDARQDATVIVEGDTAKAIEGHNGSMVDREWLKDKISEAMISDTAPDSFVALVSDAPSRITITQAEEMRDAINQALKSDAVFTYQGKQWTADSSEIGNWTKVETVPDGDGYMLSASIDPAVAIPAIVKGTGATVKSSNTSVTFEKTGDDVMVHTSGSGQIPEVSAAFASLNDAYYGEQGRAWSNQETGSVEVEITESDRPEYMPFDQALELGVITVVGEYTTDFANYEGTENRNHNIKLAADILNNAIIAADGGVWDFNTESGDTNEEAGFWSAGSIINGEYEDSIGGGICQVATTIFNAVYEGGLDVVERHNHSLYIASYPEGRDASVSYPDLNFTWKNQLSSDIYMRMSYTDTSVTCQLYSVYTGYTVKSETGEWKAGAKYQTRFKEDETLPSGTSYLKSSGENGSEISVTRTVLDEKGNVVKGPETFSSVYEAKDEVYLIGPGTDTSNLARSNDSASSSDSNSMTNQTESYDSSSDIYDYSYDMDYGYAL